ncbi:DNA repair protein RecN [Nereida sp. MMG025]|uniref:DNA repair protein RecN n=1 Tax=Nereida sp. MMG025 TaxID=2909981 RepID=UPI001EFFA07A|nr:DNA repair protein RecN [Nereida sp. MMG025]MCF6445242.1 DNA repair protein RecN [Nereida sp. MMG025]
MLRGLDIRDMLIIDRLELDFAPGLNVLTGETGAGKSILLDSLGFVLGWRGRAELVRQGADQGEVTAWFDLSSDHPAFAVLAEAGWDTSDAELILRRVNTRDGRKTAWINDKRASGEVLRAVSETLVELHGQHDDRGLLNPKGHRALLDEFAGLDRDLDQLAQLWRAARAAQKALAAEHAALAAVKEEEEFLRHAHAELSALAPQAGEEAELDAKRRLMQGAEKIREDVGKAFQALSRDGAEGAMDDAMRWLDDAAPQAEGQLDSAIGSLGRALSELAEAQAGIEGCLDALAFNPAELEDVEERLFALRGLARKHNVLPDDLGAFASAMQQKIEALDGSTANIAALEADVAKTRAAYDAAAVKVSAKRTAAAQKLDAAMAAELAPLKMERAIFTTDVTRADAGPGGVDDVAFRVATNPGAPSGPLNKIASGGELSRFLLALKVCLTRETQGMTMIFDEIDRGVGGATADAVGRRLAEVASKGQVLVVTHSPQVAALGAHHWRVEKRVVPTDAGEMTTSTVVPLDAGARIDELARMLSGDRITDEARGAARALLAS